MKPTVGRVVHYVGSDGVCRPALVGQAGAWVTVDTVTPDSFSRSEGRPIRQIEQWFFDDAVELTAMLPHGSAHITCRHDELPPADKTAGGAYRPGTWHWPERA